MRASLATAFALIGVASLAAQRVRTIVDNGPVNNRYDIVILGDGYQAHEESKFDQDALQSVTTLFNKPAYGTYQSFFNVHTVFRASNESGADHPDANPPITRDTVYDASYNIGGTPRCLYIRNTSQATADSRLAPDVEGRVIVLVNDTRYGGCAGTFAVSYTGPRGPEVQAHEFGHSFGRLADEYDYGRSGRYSGPEPGAANITADSTGRLKWPLWLGFNGIATFEGAGYYRRGLWRPKQDCLMRTLDVPLCEVCDEQLVRQAYVEVDPIENRSPAQSTVSVQRPSSQVFSFTSLVPGNASIVWSIDGVPVASGSTSYRFDSVRFAAGRRVLSVEVRDLTDFVRSDPNDLLTSSTSWTVDVISTHPGTYTTYGTGCPGSGGAVPALTAVGAPEIGLPMDIVLDGAVADAAGVLLFGFSDSRWQGFALPLDMAPYGGPGCLLLASGEGFEPFQADAAGRAVHTLRVPNNPALVGKDFFNQFVVRDANANLLGVVFSNAGMALIGRP